MSGSTRSSAIDSGVVKTLAGLSDDDTLKFRDTYSLARVDDLALLDKADLDAILGNDATTFLKRRKMWALVQYLKTGAVLTASTTLTDLHAAVSPGPRPLQPSAVPALRAPSPMPAPIRLSSSDFPKFSGDINNQDMYRTKAEAQIGQTTFKFLLARDANIAEEKEIDQELFNVFKNSFLGGTAYHLIERSLVDANGKCIGPIRAQIVDIVYHMV